MCVTSGGFGRVIKDGPRCHPDVSDPAHQPCQRCAAFGQHPRIGWVLDVGRHDGGVGPQPGHINDSCLDSLPDQSNVQFFDRGRTDPFGDLHQPGRVRCPLAERDPTEPKPTQRVGHLSAQRPEPEPIPVFQEHQPQERLHRDRRSTKVRVEPPTERLKEPRVVQQAINRDQFRGHHQRLRWQQRFPQRRLRTYGTQHDDGSDLQGFTSVIGAIIACQIPARESTHPQH